MDQIGELLHDGWAAQFAALCQADAQLGAISGRSDFSFLWDAGGPRFLISVRRGQVQAGPADGGPGSASFSVSGPVGVWRDYLLPVPPPGRHDLMALWVTGQVIIEGDQKRFAQNLGVTRRLLELARVCVTGEDCAEAGPQPPAADIERVTGRYLDLEVMGARCPVYFEEAGQGPAVLLLHTAGSDSRQYHSFLADPAFTEYRLVACDLPYHGRSSPPAGWWTEPYRLTQEFYASFVETFCDALGLDHPVLVGASMGAQIVLELMVRRPDRYAAVVAFGPVGYVGREMPEWLHHPEVNETDVVPGWVLGMTGPRTPLARRQEIRWAYSQGGSGVFAGDGHFFLTEWDIRDRLHRLDTARCPVFLFAGEYDYSRPPQAVRNMAEAIPGASYTELPGCGHFPMVEAPEDVIPHLLAILAAVART